VTIGPPSRHVPKPGAVCVDGATGETLGSIDGSAAWLADAGGVTGAAVASAVGDVAVGVPAQPAVHAARTDEAINRVIEARPYRLLRPSWTP